MKIIAKNSWLVFQAIIPQDYVEMSVIKNFFLRNTGLWVSGQSYFLPIRPGEIIAFSKSIDGFRNIIKRSYKHIPIYNKKDKKWFLNNNVIDINEYNPVSTISESGE